MADDTTGSCGARFRLWQTALKVKANPIETSEFLIAAKECIKEGNAGEVLALFQHSDFQELTQYVGWEMIAVVFPHLKNPDLNEDCTDILDVICRTCSPKEVILGLNEQLNEVTSVQCLVYSLQFLKKSLLRLTRRQARFLRMICDDVSKQFRKFTRMNSLHEENDDSFSDQRPDIEEVQGSDVVGRAQIGSNTEETKHLKSMKDHTNECDCLFSDEMIERRLCCMANAGLDFIHPFIDHVGQLKRDSLDSQTEDYTKEEVDEIQQAALLFVLNILDCPLSWFELPERSDKDKHENCIICKHNTRSIALRTVKYVFSFNLSFVQIMEYRIEENFSGEDDEVDNPEQFATTKAMMCHCMLVDDVGLSFFPFILKPAFLVILCMKPMALFLKSSGLSVELRPGIMYGLSTLLNQGFAENIINRLATSVFSSQDANLPQHLEFFEMLINIMIYRDDRHLRQRALSLFHHSLRRYEFSGRLVLLRQLLANVNHPGACGVFIQCIIKEADVSFEKVTSEEVEYQCGPGFSFSIFIELLEMSLSPINAVDFDPLFQSERILSSLNLLRFLLLRDGIKYKKKVFLCDTMVKLEKDYLNPLRKAINASRSNHTSLLRETLEGAKSGSVTTNAEDDGDVLMTVNGCDINQISSEEKVQQLHIALNTLDMMESLLSRVSEISSDKERLRETLQS